LSPVGGILIAVLLALAVLHFYWGVGGRWPGTDDESLRLLVVGTQRGQMPGFLPSAMVAGALAAAAAVVWARHSAIMTSGFGWIMVAGYVVLILVFGLRGIAPYVTPVFEYARGAPFFELNRLYYAPLCLLIAAGLAINAPFYKSAP
jgi:hypothetical protein